MNTSEIKANQLDLINNSTSIYDKFDPIIKEKVKQPRTFQKILQLTKEFMTKNEYALSTNIIGRRVLVNQKMEEDIYDALGIEKSDIKKAILESPYFKGTFGRELSLTDQLCLAFPLILAALEYRRIKKQDESDLCYLLAHFKPYSSRESLFFKFGVKEGQMLYTVEKTLSERFDIKKYGTIINVLRKRAQSSYENYIIPMKETEKYSDKKLYVTYTSGIAGSVNTFIGTIVEEYRKNEGKSLDFEGGAKGAVDKDSDETEYIENDIQSDEAIKKTIIDRTLSKITKAPVDKSIAIPACQITYNTTGSYLQILMNTVDEIVDSEFNVLKDFFYALLSAFLLYKKPNGEYYSIADFRSPVFINVGIDILAGKKSNVNQPHLLKCREIIKDMCEKHCSKYIDIWGKSYQAYFRKALAAYWVLLMKTANNT